MPEYQEVKNHPFTTEIKKRASFIIRMLGWCRYSDRALYRAQEMLIKELISVEDGIKYNRSEQSKIKEKAAKLVHQAKKEKDALSTKDKEEQKNAQIEAEVFQESIQALKFGRWLFRYIADGIAWRVYSFERRWIRALGGKEPVPFMSDVEGIDPEINFFRALRKLKRSWLPLMHDLTNCIRTHDYSIFSNGQLIHIVELKIRKSSQSHNKSISYKPKGREARQINRMENIFHFIETGDMRQLYPELPNGKAINSSAPQIHNYKAISKAIRSVRKRRNGFEEPEDGVLYLAWDLNKSTADEAILAASKKHPHIFNSVFTFRSINPRYDAYHLSLPITAMDLPVKDILDILFSKVAVICVVNYFALEAQCNKNGIPLYIEQDGDKNTIFRVKSETFDGQVLDGLWDRVMLEGLSLQAFMGLLKSIMSHEFHADSKT